MSTPALVVTGSTGRLGGRAARRLSEAGVAQRPLVRGPARAPAVLGAEVVRASFGDVDAARALVGARTVLMVSGSEDVERVAKHRSFLDAAVDAGVEHIVYTSSYGAAPDATSTHARHRRATEEHLRASGLAWTSLRDKLYRDFFPLLAGEDGVIRGPAGQGRTAAVALDDIADVATAVLLRRGDHAGRTYDLTGPAALTLDDVAAELTETTGRPVRYVEETLEEAYVSRASYGAPDWEVDAWVSTYTAIAAGELAGVSGDVATITGREPRSLEDVLAA